MPKLNKWDNFPKQLNDKCLSELIARVEEIDGDTVGIITAQEIIDIVTENLAPEIYNVGLRDAKKLLQTRMLDVETDLDMLEQ